MFDRFAEQLGLNAIPQIFFISAAMAVLFVAFAIPFNAQFADFFGMLTSFTAAYFGWFYILSVTGLLIFLIWVALSRYGHIRLSADHEEPEYGTATWFAMLFAAGIGTILMFWGVAEPMSHFANPPLNDVEGGTAEAAELAMTIALYHFGLHTWTIFTLPALAIGYFAYRQGLPMRISSIFYTVLGRKIYVSFESGEENSADITFSPRAVARGWQSSDLASNVRRVYLRALSSGAAFDRPAA